MQGKLLFVQARKPSTRLNLTTDLENLAGISDEELLGTEHMPF